MAAQTRLVAVEQWVDSSYISVVELAGLFIGVIWGIDGKGGVNKNTQVYV